MSKAETIDAGREQKTKAGNQNRTRSTKIEMKTGKKACVGSICVWFAPCVNACKVCMSQCPHLTHLTELSVRLEKLFFCFFVFLLFACWLVYPHVGNVLYECGSNQKEAKTRNSCSCT